MIAFIQKLLSGFKFWNNDAVIGKWIYYGILFVVFTFVSRFLFPARPVTSQPITAQTIEKVINEAPAPENKKKFFLGGELWGWSLGVTKI